LLKHLCVPSKDVRMIENPKGMTLRKDGKMVKTCSIGISENTIKEKMNIVVYLCSITRKVL